MLSLLDRYTMREKAIVVCAFLVVIGLGVHAFVIEPYQQCLADLNEEIVQQRDDLAWMRTAWSMKFASVPLMAAVLAEPPPTGSLVTASRIHARSSRCCTISSFRSARHCW